MRFCMAPLVFLCLSTAAVTAEPDSLSLKKGDRVRVTIAGMKAVCIIEELQPGVLSLRSSETATLQRVRIVDISSLEVRAPRSPLAGSTATIEKVDTSGRVGAGGGAAPAATKASAATSASAGATRLRIERMAQSRGMELLPWTTTMIAGGGARCAPVAILPMPEIVDRERRPTQRGPPEGEQVARAPGFGDFPPSRVGRQAEVKRSRLVSEMRRIRHNRLRRRVALAARLPMEAGSC